MEHHAIAPGDAPNDVHTLKKASIAHRLESTKAFPMLNVLKKSINCGNPLSTPEMCSVLYGQEYFFRQAFKAQISLLSWTPSQTIVRLCKRFGSLAINEAGYWMLELGIYFLGGLVLTIFNKLGRDFHRHSFDGVAKSMRTRSCFKLLVPTTENCE